MPDPVIYGIDTCDTVRKARQWLKAHAIDHRFHDFRRDGLGADMLARWLTHVPWDALLNRRGLTWRKLDDGLRSRVVDQPSAVELMLREPTLIKRPVLEHGERLLVGFSDALYASLLASGRA
ncbi:MAG TPA: ArsC family reductase [Burkholderiaceae bacterium]|nr:ArsC family reductase [Burkholderiaceae bacterium]